MNGEDRISKIASLVEIHIIKMWICEGAFTITIQQVRWEGASGDGVRKVVVVVTNMLVVLGV